MRFHSMPLPELLSELQADPKQGLTSAEIQTRQAKYGPNKLREKKKKTNLQRFIDQFKDVMILILIAAAIVSFVVICVEQNWGELFEPALILLIVILNAIMGVYQEGKAEKALDALKNMSAPHARVIRNGEETVIQADQLVPGDVIRLEAGDFVPADARLIASVSLKSEESALTGESVPSEKDASAEVAEKAPIGDRTNMIFSGCSVTYGTATAVVTATGMDTEMGKIANLLDNEGDGQTPLQQKLAQLGKYLGIVALAACAIIFIVGLVNSIPPLEIFMTAVSLAVSAIPEGLPAIVTIVLSIGVQRMVKRNALIRRLPAVETLGSASIICSDKTGTLTQNRMTLTKAYAEEAGVPEEIGNHSDSVNRLLMYATLCCDGSVVFSEGKEQHIGDPTETAIVLAAHKSGMAKDALNEKYPRLGAIPFDSDRKLMTTVNGMDGKNIVIVKGAFDMMAQRCKAGDLEKAKEITEAMSRDALRVLAVAYKEIDTLPETLTSEEIEKDLTFMGLVGMIDPPRPEAKEAVAVCRKAGIKPVMITGDHVVTASAIAKELGILEEGDLAITGAELDGMSESELDQQVERISVYARVSPENKIRIVKAWQRKGQVVSMTGDGVNDAPALKAADIGCAMGITGTDVAKGAADMTLTDDNFATIVEAVREGRGIYANIKKVVGFLLGTNIGEVITVFLAMLLWHKTPLLSMQLLWINLVTDSLPAIALGMEAVEADVMEKKPKPKNEGIFANGLGVRVVLQGMMFAALTLAGFWIGWQGQDANLAQGQTMAFMILALSQIVQAFNMRSDHSLFRIGFFGNRTLNLAALASLALVALVLFTPVGIAFGLVILPWEYYLIALGLIFVPLVVMELSKLIGLVKSHH
ncbi:MAG: calcium-translocating P-type ATPase, PMCA-type [Oscillospiraceae bacterium]|nr:calcium-translocating P-type ATPase, PMCA-type [Oscillospiraceae bacterium]